MVARLGAGRPGGLARRLGRVFNLSGSEIVFLLIIALVVLGPEKLPDAVRKFGTFYGEFKRMSSGFQTELRNALDEPMKEMRDTADAMRKAANLDFEPTRVDGDTGQPAPVTPEPVPPDDTVALSSPSGDSVDVDADAPPPENHAQDQGEGATTG
jgi:sec-independent protein translocase protein TatB